MYGYISPHLPRFQVIEIEALSIRKFVRTSTIEMVSTVEEKILFREESHVFVQCLKASEGCINSHDFSRFVSQNN